MGESPRTENPRIEELRRRVLADPASIAFAALAEEYRRVGRFDEAIETCTAGLKRHPSYLSAHVTLGRALIEVGRFDEAEQELQFVLRAAPENLAAIRGMAEIHNRRDETEHGGSTVPGLPAVARSAEVGSGFPVPGSPVPGSPVPGSSVPGSSVPGSSVPGFEVPAVDATPIPEPAAINQYVEPDPIPAPRLETPEPLPPYPGLKFRTQETPSPEPPAPSIPEPPPAPADPVPPYPGLRFRTPEPAPLLETREPENLEPKNLEPRNLEPKNWEPKNREPENLEPGTWNREPGAAATLAALESFLAAIQAARR